MSKRIVLFLFFLTINFQSSVIFAQNTVNFRLMVYNILHYPIDNTMSDTRYNDFGAIAHYLQPDIIGVNELYDTGDARGADSLLIKGLNTNGISYYQRAELLTPNNNLNNMLFYNSQKFTLYNHVEINTIYRNLDYYTLYVNDPNLICSQDTVFFDVAVGHLKASTGINNANDRATMAQALMNYINARPANRNIIYMGDCNLYYTDSVNEPAYNIITGNQNAMPMIDVLGTWTRDNAAFVNYFTQSTRGNFSPYLGTNGGASGGLDDRFDFIFMNNNLRNALQDVAYVNGSYHPVGNDGQHYNKSILESPANTDVPAAVAQHIFNMSDHYPIIADFVATLSTQSVVANASLSPNSTTQICSGSSATLMATATLATNQQIEWYDAPDATTPVATGSTFTTPALSSNISYHCSVHDTQTNCKSPQTLIIPITVAPISVIPQLSANSITEICSGATATLIVETSLNPDEQIEWFDSPNATTPIYIGNTYSTPSLNASTTYYVNVRNTALNCPPSETLVLTVVVTPPISISVSGNNTACGTTTATYTASPNNLTSYNWNVNNGIVVSGQGTATVVVQWNNTNVPATISVVAN